MSPVSLNHRPNQFSRTKSQHRTPTLTSPARTNTLARTPNPLTHSSNNFAPSGLENPMRPRPPLRTRSSSAPPLMRSDTSRPGMQRNKSFGPVNDDLRTPLRRTPTGKNTLTSNNLGGTHNGVSNKGLSRPMPSFTPSSGMATGSLSRPTLTNNSATDYLQQPPVHRDTLNTAPSPYASSHQHGMASRPSPFTKQAGLQPPTEMGIPYRQRANENNSSLQRGFNHLSGVAENSPLVNYPSVPKPSRFSSSNASAYAQPSKPPKPSMSERPTNDNASSSLRRPAHRKSLKGIDEVYQGHNLSFATHQKGRMPTLYFKGQEGSGRLRLEHPVAGPEIARVHPVNTHGFFPSEKNRDQFHRTFKIGDKSPESFNLLREHFGGVDRPVPGYHHAEAFFDHTENQQLKLSGVHRSGGVVMPEEDAEFLAQKADQLYTKLKGARP